jgi:hypothetical protein
MTDRHAAGAMRADKVTWIAADVAAWTPPRPWTVWHDRAVFHFQRREA